MSANKHLLISHHITNTFDKLKDECLKGSITEEELKQQSLEVIQKYPPKLSSKNFPKFSPSDLEFIESYKREKDLQKKGEMVEDEHKMNIICQFHENDLNKRTEKFCFDNVERFCKYMKKKKGDNTITQKDIIDFEKEFQNQRKNLSIDLKKYLNYRTQLFYKIQKGSKMKSLKSNSTIQILEKKDKNE